MKRRDFLTLSIKSAMAAGYTSAIPASLLYSHTSHAALAMAGLSDPAAQPLFTNLAPNAMAAAFKYVPNIKKNKLTIQAAQTTQMTGLVSVHDNGRTKPVSTTVGDMVIRPVYRGRAKPSRDMSVMPHSKSCGKTN